jgi:hypothetical protein
MIRNSFRRKELSRLSAKYSLAKLNKNLALILGSSETDIYPSEEERDEHFTFLRETALAYDNYAEELFWCWKGHKCHPDKMKDHCSSFASLIEQFTLVDMLASRDPTKREVDALLGEDEHQRYAVFQMPNVALYLVYICKDYRYQTSFLPNARYHRGQ